MNILFSIASGLWVVVAVVVAYLMIPARVWNSLPEVVRSHRRSVLAGFVCGMLAIITFRAFNTYGPRNSIEPARICPGGYECFTDKHSIC